MGKLFLQLLEDEDGRQKSAQTNVEAKSFTEHWL